MPGRPPDGGGRDRGPHGDSRRARPHTFVALRARPAFHARFVPVLVTGIVSKEVVSGSAELIAAEAIVIIIADYSDLILKVGNPCIVLQRLPLPAGVDHA